MRLALTSKLTLFASAEGLAPDLPMLTTVECEEQFNSAMRPLPLDTPGSATEGFDPIIVQIFRAATLKSTQVSQEASYRSISDAR